MNEDRTVGSVVGPDPGLGGEIAEPKDVGVVRPRSGRIGRGVGSGYHVEGLVGERAVVAIGHSPGVEA